MTNEEKQEDFLSEAEQAFVAGLSKELVSRIDETILANVGPDFLKVARIVGDVKTTFPDVPAVFISQRVAKLANEGLIESQGNLKRMRFSEVRLPNTKSYRYNVSLRCRHPSMNPDEITKTLKLTPFRSWKAGLPRSTPKGRPLEGTYAETYWTADVMQGEWPEIDLNEAIGKLLDQLESYKKFFHQITSEGGNVEFFVGWYFKGNSGDVFNHTLMARMSELKINLSLDIYPPD